MCHSPTLIFSRMAPPSPAAPAAASVAPAASAESGTPGAKKSKKRGGGRGGGPRNLNFKFAVRHMLHKRHPDMHLRDNAALLMQNLIVSLFAGELIPLAHRSFATFRNNSKTFTLRPLRSALVSVTALVPGLRDEMVIASERAASNYRESLAAVKAASAASAAAGEGGKKKEKAPTTNGTPASPAKKMKKEKEKEKPKTIV